MPWSRRESINEEYRLCNFRHRCAYQLQLIPSCIATPSMSEANFKEFLGSLVDAALNEPQVKKRKGSPTTREDNHNESTFGYAQINKLEHCGRMLQKYIHLVVEEAPTLEDLDEISKKAELDDFTRCEAKGNKLVRMVAALKTNFKEKKIPIFNEILEESIQPPTERTASLTLETPLGSSVSKHEDNPTLSLTLPKIKDPQLQARVFQHKSMSANKTYLDEKEIVSQHNERLEFLGDSVLNTMVTKILYERFPYAKEGQLSQMRATLVCNKTLAEFSQAFNFHRLLRCNIDEEHLRVGKQKVYADIFEAYLGALAIERGFDLKEVQDWLSSLMDKKLRKMGKELEKPQPINRNAKAELYAMVGSASMHPQYVPVNNGNNGDVSGENTKFTVQCVMGLDIMGEGEAPNFRDAGLRAAMAALKNKPLMEKYSRKRAETDRSITVSKESFKDTFSDFPLLATDSIKSNKFAKNEAYAYFGKAVGIAPTYTTTSEGNLYKAEFKVKDHTIAIAHDVSKKNAEHRAAVVVLQNKDKIDEFLRWLD